MGLELLKEADMILNDCGRPMAPPGSKFVDLPRMFGYATAGGVVVCVGVPYVSGSQRVQNKASTLFMCEGLAILPGSTPRFNIRWPSGRYLLRQPPGYDGVIGGSIWFPTGYGSQMIRLAQPEPIPADGRVVIDTYGGFSLYLVMVGRLRYVVTDKGPRKGAVSCIVGYPAEGREQQARPPVPMMPNPIAALANMPTYPCELPNGNIMAPQTWLGNQCTPETPEGKRHNQYTLFSDPITVLTGQTSTSNAVLIPGNDDVIFRRMRVHCPSDESSNIPTFGLRTPSGYSVTGGDLVPVAYGQQWFYFFPGGIRCKAGDRLILDVGNFGDDAGAAPITTTFEFDGVKEVSDQ